ncbi:MAG: penicillin-binding protein activator [Hyphomicrobiales bacterium]|nr:penicillin-binding protein activator [Hyphomicrobiales bacterium]MCP5370390.1 penicillin-binding protein activator [Hyphomicrobiales bacterium]
MTGSTPLPHRFSLAAGVLAALLAVAACQSSQNARPAQGEDPRPVAGGVAAPGAYDPDRPLGTLGAPPPGTEPNRPGAPLFGGTLAPSAEPGLAARGTVETGGVVPPPPAAGVTRVAMLVPMTGPVGPLGKAMANAAQLALFDFAGPQFEITFYDSQGTADGAARAAAEAVADGASMILGPLLADSVTAAAPIARAANVRVVAFSSTRQVAGDGVYTLGFLPSAQVRRVVDYALNRGLRTFAALAPDNDYGRTVVAALQQAAEAGGGALGQVRYYDPTTEEFAELVRELADFDARQAELERQKAALRGRKDEVSKRALARLAKLQTVGDVSFDALMIAEGGKRLQNIAAHLPYYDIDPVKVRILGTGLFDEPGIGTEPALVGAWFAAPPPGARADFVTAYKRTYGDAPPRLATLAYDAAALAAVLARQGPGSLANDAMLTSPSGFLGRDGIFRFSLEGIAERGLAVIEVRERELTVIGPAPASFEGFIN